MVEFNFLHNLIFLAVFENLSPGSNSYYQLIHNCSKDLNKEHLNNWYGGDLNNGLVQYSNDWKYSNHWMICLQIVIWVAGNLSEIQMPEY